MNWLRRAFQRLHSPIANQRREGPSQRRHVSATRFTPRLEVLESRWVPTSFPFAIVNSSGFSATQVQMALYCQDYSASGNYWYIDAAGTATQTQGLATVPTFTLQDLVVPGTDTYSLSIPDTLGSTGLGPKSARLYFGIATNGGPNPFVFTVNGDSVGSVNNPPTASLGTFYLDYIEFSLNTGSGNPTDNLNIDTTSVDGFAIPLTVLVASTDSDNIASGVGIGTPPGTVPPTPNTIGLTRSAVISQFQTFVNNPQTPNAAAFAGTLAPVDSTTGQPFRINNPSDVIIADEDLVAQTFLQGFTTYVSGTTNSITVSSASGWPGYPGTGTWTTPFDIYINFGSTINQESCSVTSATVNGDGSATFQLAAALQFAHFGGEAVTLSPAPPYTGNAPLAIDASQTTIRVNNTLNVPGGTIATPATPFLLQVDSEVMQVTSVTANSDNTTSTWTVVRGVGGTTAASHDNYATVFLRPQLTADPLNSFWNTSIDALFSLYNPNSATYVGPLLLTGSDGNTYSGTVVQNSTSTDPGYTYGCYALQFTSTAVPGVYYNVYYPFFTDNFGYWGGGYTPALTPADAPPWATNAALNVHSPSWMVFACKGVFADSTYQTQLTSAQQTVLGNLEDQIVSALNRGVSQLAGNVWDSSPYYTNGTNYNNNNVWNYYAQFFHQQTVSIGGLNYGFAFDDQESFASDIGVASFTSVSITLSPWNIAHPASASMTRNGSFTFSAGGVNQISVADAAAGSSTVSIQLAVSNGTLTLPTTTGLAFAPGFGNGTAEIQATGTLAAINNALNGLVYTPTPNTAVADTLEITYNDAGSSPPIDANATVDLTVTAQPPLSIFRGRRGFAMLSNRVLSVPATNGLLAGVTSPDHVAPLTIRNLTPVSGPSAPPPAVNTATGAFTYTPPTGFRGTVVFSYTVFDGLLDSDPFTVAFNVGNTIKLRR